MGFWVTTLIFILSGVAASLSARLCCNRGPSLHQPVPPNIDNHSNCLLLDDVGNCIPCADESPYCSNSQRRRVRCSSEKLYPSL